MTDTTLNSPSEQDLDSLKAEIQQLTELLEKMTNERNEYQKLYELVHLECERLRRHVFGKKSERVAEGQLTLDFLEGSDKKAEGSEDPEENEPSPNSSGNTKNPGKKKNRPKPHGRKPLPEHLPKERIELPAPLEVQENPQDFRKIGEHVSETLEWRPSSLVRVQIVRQNFARIDDDAAGIIASDLPTKPIEKGLAGPGMMANIIISKYADHLPLHRLQRIWERHHINLSRSTMCGWIKQCANLAQVLYNAMWNDAMNAHCIATDATGVLERAPEQCWRGHVFVAIADYDHVLYRYYQRHNGETIRDLLGGYKGNILADAHPTYNPLYEDGSRIEFACMSHARRYFFDSLSTDPKRGATALNILRPLFNIEKKVKGKPPDVIRLVRQHESKPIIEAFFQWCDEQWPLVLEHTPIYIALRYARNQKEALSRFLDDGKIAMHNNFSELKLRHIKIGTKNWLFFGSKNGANWNCIFNTLIASCALHDIEPWAYIRDILILLPDWPQKRVLELSPKFWKQTLEQTDARQRLEAHPFRRVTDISRLIHDTDIAAH